MIQIQHIVDCNVRPLLPRDWKGIESHAKAGQFELDMSKIKLHFSPNQLGRKRIKGKDLLRELTGELVLNANVLDYLLKHPGLIPKEWARAESGFPLFICFFGTIYRDTYDARVVRCLYWAGDRWSWAAYSLIHEWDADRPAAVLAA